MTGTKIDELLVNQLYLSKFGGVSMEYSDGLTLGNIKTLTDKLQEWQKDEAKSKGKRDNAKFRALFRGLAKMFRSKK